MEPRSGRSALYALNLAAIFVLVLLYVFVTRHRPSGYATGLAALVVDAAYTVYLLGAIYILIDSASL
jgi:hypothetical protein